MSETIPTNQIPVSPTPIMPKKKWYAHLINLLILGLALYGAWSIYNDNSTNQDATTTAGTASTNITNSDNVISTSPTDQGWLTYDSTDKGFSISYPSDWTLTTSQETDFFLPTIELRQPDSTNDQADLSVYYYPTIADDLDSSQGNNQAVETLDDYISSNPLVTKVGTTTLSGIAAYNTVFSGEGNYFTVLAVNNQHLYKIMFNNYDVQSDLTNTDQQIIDSFQFTN